MPWEHVGDCGTGQLPDDLDWVLHCYETAVTYLSFILGDPPAGCELGIMWHEYELGKYPSVGVNWDFPQSDAPWEYIRNCESLLSNYNEAIDWFAISPTEAIKLVEDDNGED